jgi:hypothetical protein
MKRLLLIISIIFLYSCKSNNITDYESALNLGNATNVSTKFFVTDKIHGGIFNLQLADSALILLSDDGNGCLQLFNKYDYTFLQTNGIYGRGPGEFPTNLVELNVYKDTIQVLDLQRNIVSLFHKDNFLNDSFALADRTFQIDKYKGCFDIFPVDNFYISRPSIKTRFALYNLNGEHIKDYNIYPDYGPNINEESKDYALRYYCFTKTKPDFTKFVSLSYIGGILEIFNIHDNSINKVTEIMFLDPNIKNSKDYISIVKDDTNIGFCGIYVTDKYIYASYSGLQFKDFKQKFLADYVVVFDWDGNQKKSYKVNGGLLGLTIDEELNRVYYITKDLEGEDIIGWFNL